MKYDTNSCQPNITLREKPLKIFTAATGHDREPILKRAFPFWIFKMSRIYTPVNHFFFFFFFPFFLSLFWTVLWL